MTEEVQLGQTADEIITSLEFMDSLLIQGVKHLQSFGTSLESRQETLEQSFLLDAGLEELAESIQGSEDDFESMRTETMKTLLQLQATLIEIHLYLNQSNQFIEETQIEFESDVVELETGFEQILGSIETLLTDMEGLFRQIDDSFNNEFEDTRHGLETFNQTLDELDNQVEQFAEVYATFDTLSDEIVSHQSYVEAEFRELNQKLEQEDLNEIQGRINTAEETFTQFLKNFENDINQNADEKLRDEITKLISDFESTCEGEIKPKLEEEFYKGISDRMDELLGSLETAKEVSDNARKAAAIAARDDFKHNVVLIENAVEEMDKCLEVQLNG